MRLRYYLPLVLLWLMTSHIFAAVVAHYELDDNAASTTVVATVSTDGTLNGGDDTNTLHTTDGPGNEITWSMDLDGSADYISVTGTSQTGAYTDSIWFKYDTITSTPYLIGQNGIDRGYYIKSSTVITAAYGTDNDFTVSAMSSGTWYNLIMIRDASDNLHCYLNGTESSTGSIAFTGDFTRSNVGAKSSSGRRFDGKLARYKTWDSDETSNVSAIYAEGVATGGTVADPLGGGANPIQTGPAFFGRKR